MWASALWVFGVELSWDMAKPLSITFAVVGTVVTAFDRWLWRLPPFIWFSATPDLNGQWSVELRSTYVSPTTGEPVAPISGSATIRQSFSTLSIRLATPSSSSFLIAHHIVCHGDGAVEIVGAYRSDPSIHLRGGESEIHYGAFRYSVVGKPAEKVLGQYWTDRQTRGSIQMLPLKAPRPPKSRQGDLTTVRERCGLGANSASSRHVPPCGYATRC